jgi:flagellar biosynthetic protein FliR
MLAGETIGNTMGLGFASMVDPQSGAATPALGQFLALLATYLFLAIGGHLTLATIVVDSYRALPVGGAWLGADSVHGLVMFGGDVFAAGLAIALPVGFALVLVQIVMGMLARSAPAMNLFAVGLPATLLAGLVLLAIAAPTMGEGITNAMVRGLDEARAIAMGH